MDDGEPLAPAPAAPDPWSALARFTPARIALGRSGSALPTREVLRFGLAHAQARDAVHLPFDADGIAAEIDALGFATWRACSRAVGRDAYLKRPDLGRRLSDESRASLASRAAAPALVIVVADGLSSSAVRLQAVPLLAALKPYLQEAHAQAAPVVIASQARVALGDEIGELLGAQAVLVLIGERPGLSSPDSLGAYLTFAPRTGRKDAERNCVSNIRPAGLSHARAAHKLAWLLREALRRELTGVALKEESDDASLLPVAETHMSLGAP